MEQILNVYDQLEDATLYYLNRSSQQQIIFQVTHISYNGFEKLDNICEVTEYSHSTITRFVRVDHYVSNCFYENLPYQYTPSIEKDEYDCYFDEDYIVKIIPTISNNDLTEFNNLVQLYKNLIGNDTILLQMWGDHLNYVNHICDYINKVNKPFYELLNQEQFFLSDYYLMPQEFIDYYTFMPLPQNSYPKWFPQWLEEIYSSGNEFDIVSNELRLDFVNNFYLNAVLEYQYQQLNIQSNIEPEYNTYLEEEFNEEFAETFFNDIDDTLYHNIFQEYGNINYDTDTSDISYNTDEE